MKAKDLAKKLLEHPEATVATYDLELKVFIPVHEPDITHVMPIASNRFKLAEGQWYMGKRKGIVEILAI